MEADAVPTPPLPGHRDLDPCVGVAVDGVEVTRRAVAQDGTGAAGENGGHQASPRGRRRAANRVDAGVPGKEPVLVDAVFDRMPADPEPKQLPPRHHRVLAIGEPPDHRVDLTRLTFSGYCRVDVSRMAHAGQDCGTRVTRGAACVTRA
jgi:hypothetical protein